MKPPSNQFSIVILVVVTLASFLGGCATRLMLYPELARRMEARYLPSPISNQHRAKKVMVKNDSGYELHGLLFKAEGDSGTVMVSGGNAMARSHALEYYKFLLGHGFRVLVFSFQGYDENEGRSNLNSLIGDAAAYYTFLKYEYPGEEVAYMGHSISSAVALCLPLRVAVLSAIIVEGVFDPGSIAYSKLKQLWYLFPLYPILLPTAVAVSATIPDELDVAKCVTTYSDIPIIFIHHPDDAVTPFERAFDLFSAYQGDKQFLIPRHPVPPQYHTSLLNDMKIQNEIVRFLQDHLSARPRYNKKFTSDHSAGDRKH
ncbi:alpha/beta hydrolase [Nitrosomonas sp. Nm33]|uniref:alpha/beta hydrolase n=1 Tax=Nitrosomonas sp. Nm33 TaxID=133724 RepID=UPI00089AB274|nr:hypothetical protein [Nitrosomonas sp. Nm33]SDX99310.1 hypothetical protein SAMN05421755_100448 [Nitrosomonas sp. Nm33]